MFTSNPANEAIVLKLVTALSDVSVGSVISYDHLRSIAGCDVIKARRDLLMRARTRTEKELRCIFEPVRGLGIRRLPAEEAVETGLYAIRGCRRKARRGAERTSRQDSNSLSRTLAQRQTSYSSLLGAAAMILDGNKARTVAAVVEPSKPIPPEDVLRMFIKK